MKTMKSLSEFIDWIQEQGNSSLWILDKIIERNDIGKMEPQLWMFIPCDAKGEPMDLFENPSMAKITEYDKVKARCWFEGWKYKRHEKSRHSLQEWIIKEDFIVFGNTNDKGWNHSGISDIEDLIRQTEFELTMTETLIKKLGL